MKSRRFMPILAAIVSASFSACGGGSGSTPLPSPPPATTYTIGGSVSGFLGIGALTLQNNSGDLLQINSNGNFTFGKPIASGGTYSVTIFTEPIKQFCVVNNSSGTADANITSVQVTRTTPTEQILYSFRTAVSRQNPES